MSVAAVHARVTWLELIAVAVNPLGAVGAVVSGASVLTEATFEYALRLPAAPGEPPPASRLPPTPAPDNPEPVKPAAPLAAAALPPDAGESSEGEGKFS